MQITLEAVPIRETASTIWVRLDTGYGEPEVAVAKEKILQEAE